MALEFAKVTGGITGPTNDSALEKKTRSFSNILAAASLSSSNGAG